MKFVNGALVHLKWGDLPKSELIASFQYDQQAKMFCELYAASDWMQDTCTLIVTDTGQGKQWFFPKKKPEASNE